MKALRNWRDLEPYGIIMLTGEACGYGYRLLCDLTPNGVEIIRRMFDMPEAPRLRENWNSSSRGEVASIMLAGEMFVPVAIFCLFNAGDGDEHSRVFTTYDGTVYGVESTDDPQMVENWIACHQGEYCEECRRYGKYGGIKYTYRNSFAPRNRHAFTGRTS